MGYLFFRGLDKVNIWNLAKTLELKIKLYDESMRELAKAISGK